MYETPMNTNWMNPLLNLYTATVFNKRVEKSFVEIVLK